MSVQKYPKYLEPGMVFGRLTVIEVDESSKVDGEGNPRIPSQWKYRVKCSCGNEVSVVKCSLCNGSTRSCGCFHKEMLSNNTKKYNKIEIEGDIAKIYFRNKKHGYVIIDTEDVDKVKDFCWRLTHTPAGNVYARTAVPKQYSHLFSTKEISLHQLIFPVQEGYIVDHINNDGRCNAKSNLRAVTVSQNAMNRTLPNRSNSGIKGVSFCNRELKWRAHITVNKKFKSLGYFKTKEEAIKARLEAEEKYFGEYSIYNSRNIPLPIDINKEDDD